MKNPNARIEYRVNLNGSFRDDVSNISTAAIHSSDS